MFLCATLEDLVPPDHPLRLIRAMVHRALEALDGRLEEIYGKGGRPSIAPERLRAGELPRKFFAGVVRQARQQGLMSSEHFSVDGKPLGRWRARRASGRTKAGRARRTRARWGRNREVDWRGQRRRNETHEATTGPKARLWRKGQTGEAKLSWLGHVVTSNGHRLRVNVRVTLAAGRGYDTRKFVGLRKVRGRGRKKVGWIVTLVAAAYNLVRKRNLLAAAG